MFQLAHPAALPERGTRPLPSAYFDGVRVALWRFIVPASAAMIALVAALNVSYRIDRVFWAAMPRVTGGLAQPTLVGAGACALVVIAGLTTWGRLSFADIGWRRSTLRRGLAVAAALWIAQQAVELVAGLVTAGSVRVAPLWTSDAWGAAIGVLLGQAFGSAPLEETFFRGFLLVQLRAKLERSFRRPALAVGAALVVSQLAFALYHLPNLVLIPNAQVGSGPLAIAVQVGLDFAIGLVFAGLYLRTGNLFLVMGVHALQNAGTSLVAPTIDPALVVLLLAALAFLLTFAPRATALGAGAAPGASQPRRWRLPGRASRHVRRRYRAGTRG
jgi:membrane protease YdiL (CAAX protease family)